MTYGKDGAYISSGANSETISCRTNMDKFIVDAYQFASDVVEGVHIVDGE
jgi:hypothetical protein